MRAFFSFTLFVLVLVSCKNDKKAKSGHKGISSTQDSITEVLQEVYADGQLPGFAVSIFNKDSIFYSKGFGYADLAAKKPFTTESVQIIASVTKTLVGVSLMKCVEDGTLLLDDDINKWLPYNVTNPNHPSRKITLRHLATHTSSIAGTKNSDKGYRFSSPLLPENFPEAHHPLLPVYNKTEDISMANFLKEKLSIDGKWYEPQTIFTEHAPGASYEYSNLGIALLAHIIEIATNTTFSEFSNKLILEPLRMASSTWELHKVDSTKHVTYYNEWTKEIPEYYVITYPDGGLYSSVADMTAYLQEIVKAHDGQSTLISQQSAREMVKKQFEGDELTEGICWDLSFEGLAGHPGNDFGTSTLMYFSPETGMGRILFTNISVETEELQDSFYTIFNTLFEYTF